MDDVNRPVLRIVRGDASPEELAALTALVAGAGSGGAAVEPAPPVRGRWNDPSHQVRRSWTHGPGGFRAAH